VRLGARVHGHDGLCVLQVERIHNIKCNELGEGDVFMARSAPMMHPNPAANRGCRSADATRPHNAVTEAPEAPFAEDALASGHTSSPKDVCRSKAASGNKRHASAGDLSGLARGSEHPTLDSAPCAQSKVQKHQRSKPDKEGNVSVKDSPSERHSESKGARRGLKPHARDTSSPFSQQPEPPFDHRAAGVCRNQAQLSSHKVSLTSSEVHDVFEDMREPSEPLLQGLIERITASQYGAEERAQLESSAANVSEFCAARQVGYQPSGQLVVPVGAL
jgi:hypothetical protein